MKFGHMLEHHTTKIWKFGIFWLIPGDWKLVLGPVMILMK